MRVKVVNELDNLDSIGKDIKSMKEELEASISILEMVNNIQTLPRSYKALDLVKLALKLSKDLLFLYESNLEYFETLEKIQKTQDISLIKRLDSHKNSIHLMLLLKSDIENLRLEAEYIVCGINQNYSIGKRTKICAVCGSEFHTKRSDQIYCSKECRNESHKIRKRLRYQEDNLYREKRKSYMRDYKQLNKKGVI